MASTIVVHIQNEDPIVGEVDDLPAAGDTNITMRSPRRRDGKDVPYLTNDVVMIVLPLSQITYIEVMPSEGEERIIGFVRE